MILQALYEYYRRKADDPDSGIAPPGFEWKEIPFVVVISREGQFVSINRAHGERVIALGARRTCFGTTSSTQ